MLKIMNQTVNGRVFICPNCKLIHFEYKNLNFNFETQKEYLAFARYFLKLDGKHWEGRNVSSHFRRKIIVPVGHKNLLVLFNNTELLELKKLFSKTAKMPKSSLDIFDSHFSEN